MITSAMISELRREYGDVPKKTRVTKEGDGQTNLFNLGFFPVIENSESINISAGAALTGGGTDYTLDYDSGDLTMNTTPGSGHELKSEHKYANWRDQNWVDAINQGIEQLNARGFYRQIVRTSAAIGISAGVRVYDAPSGAVDVYELLVGKNANLSASITRPGVNWSYQQDANKIILGNSPSSSNIAYISYLRRINKYNATSATLDLASGWHEPVKKYAGAKFNRFLAGKIAQQGNATIDEGHLSFTNLRTMANDLNNEFEVFAARSKPTRPAKDMQYHIAGGGNA